MDNSKSYMLKCWLKIKPIDYDWHQEIFYFDTEEEMIRFVKGRYKDLGYRDEPVYIKIESAFKLEKLDNNIF